MKIIIAICLFNIVPHVFSQNDEKIKDTSFLKCEYIFNYCADTTLSRNHKLYYNNEEFLLVVGRHVTKYYSKETNKYEEIMNDSEASAAYTARLQLAVEKAKQNGGFVEGKIFARKNPLVIYVDLQHNKRIVQDATFLDYYVYEEENTPQSWTIMSDSTKEILGYDCQKAICTYRGREYEAWFSSELPISTGPWKFAGLPGLIMHVKDRKGHYVFEIKGIEKRQELIEYVEFKSHKYTKSHRVKVLQAQAKASNIDWGHYIRTTHGNGRNNRAVEKLKSSNSGRGTARYDLIEKDYKSL